MGFKLFLLMDASVFSSINDVALSPHASLRKKLKEPLFDAINDGHLDTIVKHNDYFLACPQHHQLLCHSMTLGKKFRKASILTTELATIASEASRYLFYRRLDLLKDLIDAWKNGKEMTLCTVDEG